MSPASNIAPIAAAGGLVAVDGRTYPLFHASLRVHAAAGLGASAFTQHYRNPHDEPLEVIYTLPLPAEAAVLGYEIHFGERVIRGVVRPREEAAETYRRALFEGRSAGLLEQDRDDVFQLRLGSLPARQDAVVEITLVQRLAFLPAAGRAAPAWEYRFPTVVGVRYDGADGRVPDHDRLEPDRDGDGGIPARLLLEMRIADRAPASLEPRSPSHPIELAADGEGVWVRFDGARLDRDAVVQWNAALAAAGPEFVEGEGLPGDAARYALVTLVPPHIDAPALARDLIVLIDASGSMSGAPLDWAKRVVTELLGSLEDQDRFELQAFAETSRSLTGGSMTATRGHIEEARRTLARLSAGGGTEMADALAAALESGRDGAQRQIVVVTDGQVGFEREVVRRMRHRLPERSRVHVVAVGAAPNRTLAQNVARAGRGVELIVSDEPGCEAAAARLVRATARPVLTNLRVTGSAVQATAPARPPDVYAGTPVVLTLELGPAGGEVEIRGTTPGTPHEWIWRRTIGARPEGPSRSLSHSIGALHGRERIADLEVERAAHPERGASIDALVERTAMRHEIVSRRTSLVAFAEEPSVDPREPRRSERLAVELPADVCAGAVGLYYQGLEMSLRETATRSPILAGGDLKMLLRAFRSGDVLDEVNDAERGALVARLIDLVGRRATFEITCPEGGLELPRDRVDVRANGMQLVARVVAKAGSRPGMHAAGLIVRLALELTNDDWPAGVPFTLTWASARRSLPPWRKAARDAVVWRAVVTPAGKGGV